MQVKDPQRDLPSSFRGGSDLWDTFAGGIVSNDYFEPSALPENNQVLSVTLADIGLYASQVLTHGQAIAVTLDDFTFDANQAWAVGVNVLNQTIAIILDDISVNAQQVAPVPAQLSAQGGARKVRSPYFRPALRPNFFDIEKENKQILYKKNVQALILSAAL